MLLLEPRFCAKFVQEFNFNLQIKSPTVKGLSHSKGLNICEELYSFVYLLLSLILCTKSGLQLLYTQYNEMRHK